MRIVLARHGETEWNRAEIFRGRSEVRLNETGRREAELLAGYLGGLKIEAVYCSPLGRATETAGIVARRNGLEAQVAPGLTDLDYGEWQGLSNREVQEKYPEACAMWTNHPEQVRIPGGETLDEVRKRALPVVEEVAARHRGTAVLITHRVVSKVLICALLGLEGSHFWNYQARHRRGHHLLVRATTLHPYPAQRDLLPRAAEKGSAGRFLIVLFLP